MFEKWHMRIAPYTWITTRETGIGHLYYHRKSDKELVSACKGVMLPVNTHFQFPQVLCAECAALWRECIFNPKFILE